MTNLKKLRDLALRQHFACEDDWYSYPLSPEGTANSELAEVCNCSADKHNKKVEETYKELAYEMGVKP